jgi:hypothetical protein
MLVFLQGGTILVDACAEANELEGKGRLQSLLQRN